MAARSLNKVILIGNLTRDPEMRYTSTGTPVCTFGMATNRSWTPSDGGERVEEVEYHRIVAWSKLGEICNQLLSKGRKVYVEGRMQTNKWTGKDNVERETTEVVIDNMIALSPPKDGYDSGGYDEPPIPSGVPEIEEHDNSNDDNTPSKKPAQTSKQQEEVDVDDIPF